MSEPRDPGGWEQGRTWAERVRAASSDDPDATRGLLLDATTGERDSTTAAQPATAEPAGADTAAAEPTEKPPPKRHRPRHLRPERTVKVIVEWAVVIVGALVVALLIKTFLFQAFYIPSQSMEPTLQKGDRVLVNKMSYRLHDVNRGDVVVFERPENLPPSEIHDLIKRVIALPGEVIEARDGEIFINGRLLEEPYLKVPESTDEITQHEICDAPPAGVLGCKVPEGHVFVMGDNRRESEDSRRFGPIDEDLVIGRAFIQIWPIGELSTL